MNLSPPTHGEMKKVFLWAAHSSSSPIVPRGYLSKKGKKTRGKNGKEEETFPSSVFASSVVSVLASLVLEYIQCCYDGVCPGCQNFS